MTHAFNGPTRNSMYGQVFAAPPALPLVVQSGLAILRIDGAMMMGGWGYCDPEQVCAAIERAADDQAIRTLLLDFHCPGGTAFGTSDLEAAAKRYNATGKRLCAIAHDCCCSSAYWLASFADEIVATHSAMVGSIGTIHTLYDDSQRFATEGVRPVVIELPGTMKRIGIPGVPITAEHEARLKQSLAIHQANFRDAVAANRGISPESIDALGGASMLAAEALPVGLIDRIVGYRDYVAELMSQASKAPAEPSAENAAVIPTEIIMSAPETKTPAAPVGPLNMSEDEMRQKFPDVVAAIEAKAKAGAKSAMEPDPEADPEAEKPEDKAPDAPANAARPATMNELKLIAPNDAAFVLDCLEVGATLPVARKMFERISAGNKTTTTENRPGRGVATPIQTRPSAKVDGVNSWEDAVQHVMQRDKCKRYTAIGTAAREFRDIHAAYVTALRANPVNLADGEGGSQRATASDLRSAMA